MALEVLVGHRAFGGGADELRVFGEDAAGFFGRERFIGFHPRGVVGFGDEQAHRVFDGVDLDEVAVFHDADGAAFGGFGRDVALRRSRASHRRSGRR